MIVFPAFSLLKGCRSQSCGVMEPFQICLPQVRECLDVIIFRKVGNDEDIVAGDVTLVAVRTSWCFHVTPHVNEKVSPSCSTLSATHLDNPAGVLRKGQMIFADFDLSSLSKVIFCFLIINKMSFYIKS